MNAVIQEFPHGYVICMSPATLQEAAILVRLGMAAHARQEPPQVTAQADGTFLFEQHYKARHVYGRIERKTK